MTSKRYSRHYFLSDSLDELEKIEEELEAKGIAYEQFHVLSNENAEVSRHEHLHEVPSLMQRDIVRSTIKGAVIGLIASSLLLVIVSLTSVTENVGWMPFIFLAIVVLGFCTWEGGFLGIQTPNKDYVRFDGALQDGKHIFFVDIAASQEANLAEVLKHHPKLSPAGDGDATPGVVMQIQHNWHEFRKVFP